MKKINITVFLLVLSSFVFLIFPQKAQAACNFYASMSAAVKDVGNWTNICTIAANTVEGIDKATSETDTLNRATLTLGTGGNITINSGGKLVTGSLILSGGNIAVAANTEIKIGTPLYVADTDADGWPDNFNSTSFFTATSSGRRRLSLMQSYTTADCGVSSYNASNTCCTANGGACGSDGACCGSVCATDADSDNYFSQSLGHTGICQATSHPYTDCGDGSSSAYPGSATCSSSSFTSTGSSNAGQASYDWNCSATGGSGTACGTIYNTGTSTSDSCCQACTAQGTCLYYFNCYPAQTTACGQSGGVGANYIMCLQGSGENCTQGSRNSAQGLSSTGTQACQ